MKKSAYLLVGICVSAFMSCSDGVESDSLPAEPKSVSRITATIEPALADDGVSTRTVFDNDKSIFVWAATDTIGIFPNTGDQVSFPIEGEAGKTTVDFNGGGWDLKADATYYAYFPFDRKNYWGYDAKNEIKISFTGQKQKGKNNADFATTYPFVSYGVNNNGNIHFSFKHLASHVVFTVTSPAAATFTKAVLTTEDGGNYFIQEGTYDLAKTTASVVPTIKAKSYGSSVTLNLSSVSVSKNESFIIFMTIPPTATLSSGVKLMLVDSSGNVYTGTPDRAISQFVSGTRYRRSFTLEGEGMFVLNTEDDDFNSSEEDNINMKQ